MYPKRTHCFTRAGQGPIIDLGHHRAFVKVSAKATGGAFLLTEFEADPGSEIPPHAHEGEDHTFYVIAGHFMFRVGKRTIVARPGDTVFVRRGVIHSWRCASDAPGCCLLVTLPGDGFASFAEELAQQANPLECHSDLTALAARYSISLLPPEDNAVL